MHFVQAKAILSSENGMNIYRGCTHGCIYCDSRSKCYNMNHAFEDIEVKGNAPEVLEKSLRHKRNKCMIGTGSMSDPYNPFEEKLQIMRRCLMVIDHYGFGVAVQTKSSLILRDLDLLERINHNAKAVVEITLTTADDNLCRIIEPNVSVTSERVAVLKRCKELGIPTIVWLSPILPMINDTEENINKLLDYCFENDVRGIICFGMGLTLREGNREYFYDKLDRYFPGLKGQYIYYYGNRYEATSSKNTQLMQLFISRCQRQGVMYTPEQCFKYLRDFPVYDEQIQLF